MYEFVIIFHVLLLLLNLRLMKNFTNPSFLYTFLWLSVLLLHYLVTTFDIISLYVLSNEILLFFFLGTVFFNLGSFFSIMFDQKPSIIKQKTTHIRAHSFLDNIMLITPLLLLPVVYLGSLELAYKPGFDNLFKALRYQKVFGGESLGLLEYLTIWVIFDATWRYLLYKHNVFVWQQKNKMIISFILAAIYAILSTGRTFFFLIIITLIGIKFLANEIKVKQSLVLVFSLLVVFFTFAYFLENGASQNNTFEANFSLVYKSLLNYLLGPLNALDSVFHNYVGYDLGLNSFRFFSAFFYKIGLSDTKPFEIIQDYTYVPFPTNVYTIYYPYLLDFGTIFAFFISFFYGFIHTKSFLNARRGSIIYSYIYALMIYPLFMSFFQDQYLSLLSTWIQFGLFVLFAVKFVLVKETVNNNKSFIFKFN